MTDKLINFFDTYLTKVSLFRNKSVFQFNYAPITLPYRETELDALAHTLAPALRKERPSNLFVYGKTGTGKTASVMHVTNQLSLAANRANIPIKVLYTNCKMRKIADTEYRLLAQLARECGEDIPFTGLPTEEIYNQFYRTIDKQEQVVLLILDEIDQLVSRAGDEILYNLTRVNAELKRAQVSIIGISNDIVFMQTLDPRVKSSLAEEEIFFAPYNATQLRSILEDRAKIAFDPKILEDGVLEKCAALAAREHGDARRALELLRVAGEVAERQNSPKISITHIDVADEKMDRDSVVESVVSQTKQFHAVLMVILRMFLKRQEMVFTGEVYEKYCDLCAGVNLRPLTQRRISDLLSEMDMMGIVNAKIISKGRYGRTREIKFLLPPSTASLLLEKVEDLIRS